MDSKRIEQLLAKYWSCESSLEEEQELREYFRGKDIPGQLKETSELFQYFDDQQQQSLPGSSFDHDVIMNLEKASPKGKVIRLSVFNLARIAAGLVVVAAAIYFVRLEVKKSYPEDTYDDPKIAFEETKKALMMISKGFGKGKQEATKISVFNEAEQQIQGKEGKK